MSTVIDLRSDTVTKPTDEMREASATAIVGDDVFGDDPTVIELESYAAELTGKEAAIFVSSGTQGNLVSLLSHTKLGDEVLLERDSHMYHYEVGGLAAIGGVIPKLYDSSNGVISSDAIKALIRPENVHFPTTTLFCIENTHNRLGGVAISPENVKMMADTAHELGLKVHLDGARIFNATTYHECDVKKFTQNVDSVQFCLSKGLSAPIGSMIAGDEEFIKLARRKRKMVGGGMRQVGVIAAPGLIALRDMRERLVIDHINAKKLSKGMSELGLKVKPAQTNIVIVSIENVLEDSNIAVENLKEKGILCVSVDSKHIRFTTHRNVTEDDIDRVLEVLPKAWGLI